jgi:uncharacterized protein (DUF486 family)
VGERRFASRANETVRWTVSSRKRPARKRRAGGLLQQAEDCMIPYLAPVALLLCSNVFMTFAWYGQLKFPTTALWLTVLVSWSIAFFEYCLAVPANRIGHQVYSAAQLKTMQEIITLIVFAIFSVKYLGEPLRWNHAVSFLFLCGAAFFGFNKWS